jgi:ribosomal protein S18 acetylase RimI-like enzyme
MDGAIAGFSVCRDNLIDLMMIDSSLQRNGLGTKLLAHVAESLFRKHSDLTLESFEGNDQANSFYRKHGWLEVRRYLDEESGVKKIVFEKGAPNRGNSHRDRK